VKEWLTMTSLSDGLPPELAQQIHPDWRKNEADYWANRDQLLAEYGDQWIAYAGGRIVTCGANPVPVLDAVLASSEHPFFTRVGREFEPWCRIRRTSFPYDSAYAGQPLPVVAIEFRSQPGTPGLALTHVIPDTGADASVLPWSDCQQLGLNLAAGVPTRMSGVGQSAVLTAVFWVWANLDGSDYQCMLQADFTGNERILGRDVLNQLEVLFRGPSQEVVINP
jgi:hypothetical protein